MAFQTPAAQSIPTIIGVGVLRSIGDLAHSKYDPQRPDREIYHWSDCSIAGSNGAPDMKFKLMWQPSFFKPDFRLSKATAGPAFVYSKNLPGYMRGMCGDASAYEELQETLAALADFEAETIHAAYKEFYLTLGPVPFLYEARQERRKDPATGERVLGKFRELHEIEWLTEKNVAALAKRVTRTRDKIARARAEGAEEPTGLVVKVDPSAYGYDVEIPADEVADWVTA